MAPGRPIARRNITPCDERQRALHGGSCSSGDVCAVPDIGYLHRERVADGGGARPARGPCGQATPESRNMRIDPLTGTAVATAKHPVVGLRRAGNRASRDAGLAYRRGQSGGAFSTPRRKCRAGVARSWHGQRTPPGAPPGQSDQGGHYHIRGWSRNVYDLDRAVAGSDFRAGKFGCGRSERGWVRHGHGTGIRGPHKRTMCRGKCWTTRAAVADRTSWLRWPGRTAMFTRGRSGTFPHRRAASG